jgi:hypothetical protein
LIDTDVIMMLDFQNHNQECKKELIFCWIILNNFIYS